MSAFIELAPIIVSGLAGVFSVLAGNFLKGYISRKRSASDFLRYELEGGRTVDVPVAKDWASLEQRLAALHQISPSLAILDGWATLASAISSRGFEALGSKFDPDEDALRTLAQLPDVSSDLVEQVRHIRDIRNMVAHARLRPDDPDVEQTARRVLPVLERLGLRFPTERVRTSPYVARTS